jgi:hypothetical protein
MGRLQVADGQRLVLNSIDRYQTLLNFDALCATKLTTATPNLLGEPRQLPSRMLRDSGPKERRAVQARRPYSLSNDLLDDHGIFRENEWPWIYAAM